MIPPNPNGWRSGKVVLLCRSAVQSANPEGYRIIKTGSRLWPVLYPSGDVDKDLNLQGFYRTMTGKNHELFNIEAVRF